MNLNNPIDLAQYSSYDRWIIRQCVAVNEHTPPETLAELGNDIIGDVRKAVAANHNTPPKTLAKLTEDSVYIVRLVATKILMRMQR